MRYHNVAEGVFIDRPNRFIAHVSIGGRIETVHVKNTGRCRELLVPGCRVWLEKADSPARKTGYDLIAVEKEREGSQPIMINMDSQIPNAAAAEWLPESGIFPADMTIRREVTYGDSRFDLCIDCGGRRSFMEVKGVTLERQGIAYFPDAPTERGIKHLNGLISAAAEGYGAYLLFVVQMNGISAVRPNDTTHPEFGETLRRAAASGVKCLACQCDVTADSIKINGMIAVETEWEQ